MAVDVTLDDVSSGYSVSKINDNFEKVEEALQDAVSRSGNGPNQMEADLDLNGNDLLNVGTVQAQDLTIRGGSIEGVVARAEAEADRARDEADRAKEEANRSSDQKNYAEEWAQSSFPISEEAGGDGISDRSAKWWAEQSSEIALPDKIITEAKISDSFLSTIARRREDDLTVKIPTDYPTLQEAVDDLSTLAVKQGARIILLIESGHQPASGILVQDGDYGHFWIEAEDTVTITERPNGEPIEATDIGVVTVAPGFTGRFLQAINSRAPVLNCLVDMNGEGPNGGYRLEQGSSGTVEMYGGIINSAGRNAEIIISLFDADYTWWDGAGERGVRIGNASFGRVRGCSIQNCTQENLAIAGSSHVVAIDSVLSGSLLDNIRVDLNSSCTLTGAVAQNAVRDNLAVANSSSAAINRADFSFAGRNGVRVIEGSSVASTDPVTIKECGEDNIYIRGGSKCVTPNSDLSLATRYSVFSERGSTGVLTNSNLSGSVRAINSIGSNIEASGCDATGSTGDRSVYGTNGSSINFQNGTATSASGAAIRVDGGSIVNATGATGTSSVTDNTLTAAGIVFR